MNIQKIAILQARMSSSRLPGKVMADVGGKPVLLRMLERVREARLLDGILVATTTDPSDDIIEQFCQEQATPCYRGSLPDVLDRYYQAALFSGAKVIVRLTADCPLIDPQVIDRTIMTFLGQSSTQSIFRFSQLPVASSPVAYSFDFAANRLPPPWKRTLPIGLDVEVCSIDALQRAWREAYETYQREHVMPFLYEGVNLGSNAAPAGSGWYIQRSTSPRGFRVALLNHAPDYGSMRWTVDTPEDLEFVRQVFARLEGQPHFSWQDVLTLLENEPELALINSEVKHKSAFDVDRRTGEHS